MPLPTVLVITPLDRPATALVRRLGSTDALGIGVVRSPADVEGLRGRYGVYLRGQVLEVPGAALVVIDAGRAVPDTEQPVAVVVCSVVEALAAAQDGADALIVKGHEAPGRVLDETTPVLLQRIASVTDLPLHAWGGIGIHTGGAAMQLGAAGVVLDLQLALYPEAGLSEAESKAIAQMDGSETEVIDGERVFARPGPLAERRLKVGQDAAFASAFRSRWPDLPAAIRELMWEMDAHRGQAAAVQPLGPGSRFAADHGIRYPIAQGPMTRVSDVAPFAKAVADGGGLPFLALSLVRGQGLEKMLTETAALLGEQPWGVGMLGFAPPELRAQQLAAVRRVKPKVALLAGGRPAQARELEADGIPTYLHVPSPGLLDLFLSDGARRFVVEGRECGGHVGPRTSFVLWEQFVEKLLTFDDLPSVSLIFAGGIHDGATASMVATLAAPLALRGARIGVIMGTAYLFTEEAVSSGAIKAGFQAAAVAAENTVLVHTAPGHATRCVESPFVHAFESTRRELEADGQPPDAVWQALEQLNLGRLRIASKGIRREGPELIEVGEEEQRDQGMFMIGQVATLQREITTISALHASVSEGSVPRVEARREANARPARIAIVGMAGFFPGAADLRAFWSQLLNGVDSVTEVPESRWKIDQYYDPDARPGDKSASKWGGFLPAIPFDPMDYGIPPNSLPAIEPVQLLALQAARQAIEDAGYGDGGFDRARASVIFGAEAGTDLGQAYGFRALYPHYLGELPPALDALLPTLTEDSFPGVLANVIAGRIANRLDLGGVNYTVDAACASSLAALDLGVKELSAGTSDMVLVGGADLHNTIADYLLFSSVHALSKTGRSRPFDSDADGIALGEGVAVIVCKRLADAVRDGDRVYAVVDGVAGSSDGRSLGLTAPRKEGQMRALRRAYERSGVDPTTVGLAEAHGTGTVVGDRTELGTLTEVFAAGGATAHSVTLGSVKSNIGHTKCAAGMAGVIKCALALHHRILPPTLHVRRPNPGWIDGVSPFVFRSRPAPWIGPDRHAGVSAFGFGGTNFHCVLAAAPDDVATRAGLRDWPIELFRFRDAGDFGRVLAHLDAGASLVDIAASLSKRGSGPAGVTIVASTPDELRDRIGTAAEGAVGPGIHRLDPVAGDLAFLFPGQGSQRPGMLAELFVAFPWLTDGIDPAWFTRMHPADAYTPSGRAAQREVLRDTAVAQPTLGLVEMAAAQLFERMGLRAAQLAGHSYGELVALTVAGAIPADRLLTLSEARAATMLAASAGDAGTMAALKTDAESVRALGLEDIHLANLNSPRQTVIAGSDAAIEIALDVAEQAGIAGVRFPVAAAFHSPFVSGAQPAFESVLQKLSPGTPDRPVIANATAEPYGDDVTSLLSRQLAEPVQFSTSLERMARDGVGIFVEVGPGNTLTRFVQHTLPGATALTLDDPDSGSLVGLVQVLARLSAAGHDFDGTVLYEGRAKALDLDSAPAALAATTWYIDGHRAWPATGRTPAHGLQLVDEPLALAGAGAREQVVLEYLDTLKAQAETQRNVLLAYLGDAPLPTGGAIQAGVSVPELAAEAVRSDATPAELLLEVVSERTGYPPEMLDLDLDLEADLSIDSIKRIEILGVLGERMGVDSGEAGRDEMVEALSGVKTLRGILEWLGDDDGAPVFERHVARWEPLPAPMDPDLKGWRVQCADAELAEVLSSVGASIEPTADTVVFAGGSETIDDLYALGRDIETAQAAGAVRIRVFLEAPSRPTEALVRSLAKEHRDLDLRIVTVDDLVRISCELAAVSPGVVRWTDGVRTTEEYVAAPIDVPPLALSRDAVVLLTGGARGITARVAIRMATSGCTLILAGRSERPGPEDPAFTGLDERELRGVLAKQGLRPRAIETRIRRVLADRAMRETFVAIESAGATFEYVSVDVADADALRALVADLSTRHGRLDWVVHGAGVNEDKLFKDKTLESFGRVIATKVVAGETLVECAPEQTRLVFFSSVAGAFGNRGQTDYAVANASLDALALSRPGSISVGWGPWAGGGMVDESLARQYANMGIGLIPPDEGVSALLGEMANPAGVHVVWMAARPEDMA